MDAMMNDCFIREASVTDTDSFLYSGLIDGDKWGVCWKKNQDADLISAASGGLWTVFRSDSVSSFINLREASLLADLPNFRQSQTDNVAV